MNESPIIRVEELDEPTVETMTFPQAIEAMTNGDAVTKLEWNDPEIFCLLKSGRLTIHNEKGFHDWIISDGDMAGNDWVKKS